MNKGMIGKIFLTVMLLLCVGTVCIVCAQNIPTGQDVGSLERDFQQRRAQDAMTKALKTKKTEPDIKEESGVIPEAPAGPAK
ncbi:MAG: hypothetical protein PHH49_07125, partial [Candidatus Omnitrophica bacterium]|nr:hypothetical protein [Candidatus Omnitrophota bacterium]MDD5488710.1 hypothetical protein [Candidatus Omnitrophota bacterium]